MEFKDDSVITKEANPVACIAFGEHSKSPYEDVITSNLEKKYGESAVCKECKVTINFNTYNILLTMTEEELRTYEKILKSCVERTTHKKPDGSPITYTREVTTPYEKVNGYAMIQLYKDDEDKSSVQLIFTFIDLSTKPYEFIDFNQWDETKQKLLLNNLIIPEIDRLEKAVGKLRGIETPAPETPAK